MGQMDSSCRVSSPASVFAFKLAVFLGEMEMGGKEQLFGDAT